MSEYFKTVALDAAFYIAGTWSVIGGPTAEQTWEDQRGMFKVNGAGVLRDRHHAGQGFGGIVKVDPDYR